MKKTIAIVNIVLLLIIGSLYIGIKWNYQNREIRLSNDIEGTIEAQKSHYTKMQEIIFGDVQVAKEYATQFAKIYPDIIKGRYSQHQGQMMQWVQESNPNFSTELYAKVQRAIEAQRESFHHSQVRLIAKGVEHDNLIQSKPFGEWFLSDIEHIDIPVIKSEDAVKVFKTGIEESNKPLF